MREDAKRLQARIAQGLIWEQTLVLRRSSVRNRNEVDHSCQAEKRFHPHGELRPMKLESGEMSCDKDPFGVVRKVAEDHSDGCMLHKTVLHEISKSSLECW